MAVKHKIRMKNGGFKVVGLTRRNSIRYFCLDCSNWRYKQITNCEFKNCYLYSFRSSKGKQNAKKRSGGIRKYCLGCMNNQTKEVSKCPSKLCPLFPYRKSGTDRSAEIA